MEVSYTIQMAAKLSGVGVHTIRAWEKRYKAIVPKRDITGHRVYSKEDIEKLILLSELCLLGYSISKIANQTSLELKEHLKVLGKADDSIKGLDLNLYQSEADEKIDTTQSLNFVLFALRSYKLDIVDKELEKIYKSVSAKDFALNIVIPIYDEIISLQKNGQFTDTQIATVLLLLKWHVQEKLAKKEVSAEREYYKVLLTGIAMEQNEIIVKISALLLNQYQFKFYYLGPNTDIDTLVETIKFMQPKMVVLTAYGNALNMGKNYLSSYLEKINNLGHDELQVVLQSNSDVDLQQFNKKKFKNIKDIKDYDLFLSQLI